MVRLYLSILVLTVALPGSFAELEGNWVGVFKGQPRALLADGTYPETETRFELCLRKTGGQLNGTFTNLDASPRKMQPIQNGKQIGDRFCFDVVISGQDGRWCVSARGGDLAGLWNRGPEGGPMTHGLGTGVRLFEIRAKKVHRPEP